MVARGATTVDERVHSTEKNLQVLIDNLSAKLSSYELQLESQSNQLSDVYTELKNLKPVIPMRTNNIPLSRDQMQRAIQQDIQQELQKKK